MTPEAHIKYTALVAGMVMQAVLKAINVRHSIRVRGHALLLCVAVISHVPLIDLHMPDLIIKGRNFQKYSDQLTTPNDFIFFLINVISFYVSIFIST